MQFYRWFNKLSLFCSYLIDHNIHTIAMDRLTYCLIHAELLFILQIVLFLCMPEGKYDLKVALVVHMCANHLSSLRVVRRDE